MRRAHCSSLNSHSVEIYYTCSVLIIKLTKQVAFHNKEEYKPRHGFLAVFILSIHQKFILKKSSLKIDDPSKKNTLTLFLKNRKKIE